MNTIVSNSLKIFLEDNPAITKIVVEKILNSKKAREAAQKARELVFKKISFRSWISSRKIS